MSKGKYLTNDEMAKAFGGYNFQTNDMKNVCKAQRQQTIQEVKKWIEQLPIDPAQRLALKIDFEILVIKPHPQKLSDKPIR